MRTVLLLMITLLTAGAQAQNQPKKPTTQPTQSQGVTPAQPTEPQRPYNPLIEHFARKNALANRWNDLEQAKDALYDLITENPSNDSLIYVLAVYYFENRNYISSVLIAQDLLTNNPKNVNLLQLAASGYEAIGLRDKALTNYELVYLQNNNSGVLYKMAVLQFELKKLAESKTNVDILLTKQDIDSMKVTVSDEANKQKEFPLKASILNLKGLLAQQANDKVAAKKAFEEALVLAPDFPMAKQNLAKLK